MDWAGTAVDFGCFAPVDAFHKVFNEVWKLGVPIEKIREPMGMLKIDHIRTVLSMPEVEAEFERQYGRRWNQDDVNTMNSIFEKALFSTLDRFIEPLPGVVETIGRLRADGIKIGSTTGYTAAMMEVVRKGAEKRGYRVDSLATPDGLAAGRPAPFMVFRNMTRLDIRHVESVVKVGDTLSDIEEGLTAGVWSIGVITGSSELGLTPEEYSRTPQKDLETMKERARRRMKQTGAHFIIDNITQLPECISEINNRILAFNNK